MSTAKLLAKNTGILFFGEVVSRALSLLLIAYLGRALGETVLGKYSFVFSFVGIFSVLSDFGTNVLLTRELSRDKSLTGKYLGNVFAFKLLAGLLATLVPVLILLFTSQPFEIKLGVLLAACAMFMYYIAFPFRAVVNAFEAQGYQSIYVVSERVIAFILGVFVIYKGYGLIALLAVLAISNASSWFIIYSLVSKNLAKLRLELDIGLMKNFLKRSMPFWFTTIFTTIYFRIDTVMLSLMKDYSVAGWYNASYKIIDALTFIPFVVITAVFPVMSKFYNKDNKNMGMVFKKSFYYLTCLALPLGLGATILANKIILFIYGERFMNSIIILQVLIWALVLIFVNYLMGYLLNSIDKQHLFTFTAGIGAVLNVVLNFILIPFYSYIGAAIATVATELFNFLIMSYFVSKSGFGANLLAMAFRPLAAAIAMGAFAFYFSSMHLLLLIPLCAALYFLILFLIGGIKDEERNLLFSLVKFRQ